MARAIKVKKFDPRTVNAGRIIFIIGKRNTGKSVLMKDILYHMSRPDFVVAMAPTEDTLQMFREFVPPGCVFDGFDQERIDRLVAMQKELTGRGKRRSALVLLDDCLYEKGILKTNAMRSIFFNGRHDNISLIVCCQYMMDIDVSLRTNVDYIFTMRENILMNRQKLHKYFFGQFERFDEFDRVMQACTQDYRALVLDGTVSATDPKDTVKWYKASTELPPFQLAKNVFWKLGKKYAVPKDHTRAASARAFDRAACGGSFGAQPKHAVLPDKGPSVEIEEADGTILGVKLD